MTRRVSAAEAKRLVHDGAEIAFLDVREAGEFGEGHPLFAIPCPYSVLEMRAPRLVPRRDVRVLLIDGGDGVAARAAARLLALGYDDVRVVAGGAPAWLSAGFALYQGVNVPSKTLGELAEQRWHPETVDAGTLAGWRRQGRDVRLFDVRPPDEHAKMRVPGSVCLPNGELAHRFPAAVGDASGPVVVTCAGRTRGIVGAIGLRLAGIDAPVHALENGTQGWALAGFALERGMPAAPVPALDGAAAAATRARADTFLARHGIAVVDGVQIEAWRSDATRTTYLLDVRWAEEAAADPAPAFVQALSGQLVQATDHWIGVRHARVVLLDDLGLRAGLAAFWLRRLGHDVAVARLTDDLRALRPTGPAPAVPTARSVSAAEAWQSVRTGRGAVVDVRGSTAFRKGHVAGAVWGIRPRLDRLAPAAPVHVIGDDAGTTALAVRELETLGLGPAVAVAGGHAALVAVGAPVQASPDSPADADAIDFLLFVHDRHDGNLDASRRYLTWEQGLIAQLDAEERSEFRLDA